MELSSIISQHRLDHNILSSIQTTLLLLLITTTTIVHTYNLDTDQALTKRGPKGSYFGYSIAQHATYEEQNKNATFKPVILVGAPKADPYRAPDVRRPGAIYKCDLSSSHECSLLDIDSATLPSTTNRTSPKAAAAAAAYYSDRNDQWLGVSVKSQKPNGYAMVCAHRHTLKRKDAWWAMGVCYSLSKNLTLHKRWGPCDTKPTDAGHEEYGFCQAGTSCDISNSSDASFGAPGAYTWRGAVLSIKLEPAARESKSWYSTHVEDDTAKVDKDSYLGMSVVSGNFFNGKMHYASGAPRSKDTIGQVLIMAKPNSRSDSHFEVQQVLDGEQMGSSFGYQLATIDFNGDGRLDLVVAAPFYYNHTEGGRVYLYANNGKSFAASGKLTGLLESKFGLALANCGDLNHDYYEDLAVGAPYDPQGGSVYIYLGSQAGPRPVPSQIIRASAISSNLQTFGYSLSGGLDVDRNGYPDLAVGSYADDSIYVLRARTIVDIKTNIEDILPININRTFCDGEKSSMPCFQFKTCFELDPAKIREHMDSVKLNYRLEAETFTGQKYSRVMFADNNGPNEPNIRLKSVALEDYYKQTKSCQLQRVFITDQTDIQTPISFKLTFFLVPKNSNLKTSSSSSRYSLLSSSSSSLSRSTIDSPTISATSTYPLSGLSAPIPILNQDEAERLFSAKFQKDCGLNEICNSHLDVDGTLAMPNETLGINEPGYASDKQINVTIRASNNAEPAYDAKLFVTHPASLIYSGFKAFKQVSPVECSSVRKNLVKCKLGNPMTKGTTKLLMIFDTQNQAGTFDFNLMVNTTSENAESAKKSYDLSGTIRRKTEIQIPTRVYPETPTQEPPAWLIMASILLGILLFLALFYCLYVNGFFERSKSNYTQAATDEPTSFH